MRRQGYMQYFSYGSNMSTRRLQARVPSAQKIGTGILEMHELKFHKVSHVDGSAKCNVNETGDPDHIVHGVLFHIHEEEKYILDHIEGVGCGYEVKDVMIKLEDGSTVEAFTYYATNIDPDFRPFCWYLEHVLRGARENRLPEDYVRVIEKVDFDPDHDKTRRDKELSIYNKFKD